MFFPFFRIPSYPTFTLSDSFACTSKARRLKVLSSFLYLPLSLSLTLSFSQPVDARCRAYRRHRRPCCCCCCWCCCAASHTIEGQLASVVWCTTTTTTTTAATVRAKPKPYSFLTASLSHFGARYSYWGVRACLRATVCLCVCVCVCVYLRERVRER